METAFGANATWASPTQELLIDDETRTVEYKQTARWNVREQRRDKRMEQVVVKTVAGLLNDRGGTLLIGVTDNREPVGLHDDYAQVKPPNADGYVNWLDTLFENNLGHAGANRLDIRIDRVNNHDICRIDIPASSRPIWTKTKTGGLLLYQRRNNSTRQVPEAETETFITERFGQQQSGVFS
ncbi:MAG: ATP-binding protein [bacterium]|nr:ATP-binding protein [bacterium]